ncbi:hypothetical protein [Fusibacter ferrireducens]|uniref:Pilus assembly protein TadE n=1 Tax=Fusibacter ferrireducens TaxID=2785058 RepID=A0ABR9ZY34_9FIRM|nr:hypothetical protein [Fusibacter ferrireducens]MBF4695382.1 hypothetical protein [Fusibacter ferrireducens]
MFSTEMAIVLPLILILLVSLLFFFVYIVYEDLIEIHANTLLFQKLYGASINGSEVLSSEDLVIEKSLNKRRFELPQTYAVDFSSQYPDTIARIPTYGRYNPRVMLLLEYGVKRVINVDGN